MAGSGAAGPPAGSLAADSSGRRTGLPQPLPSARPSADRAQSALPWTIAAIALLAFAAFIAGQKMSANRPPAAAAATPGAPLPPPPPSGQPARAPDISSLSPEERADRLFNRVMALAEQRDTAQLRFFAPMAVSAYQMLGESRPLNADQRYDLGRIGQVAGADALARAQADSILRENPTHLLGLILAANLARSAEERRALERRFSAARDGELRKALPEYLAHRADIDSAVARARRGS